MFINKLHIGWRMGDINRLHMQPMPQRVVIRDRIHSQTGEFV